MPTPTPDRAGSSAALTRWLALATLALALPLGWLLVEPLVDPLREVRFLSGGAIWAGVLAALCGGVALGMASRRGRAGLRRGLLLAGGMAVLVGGCALAYGAIGEPAPGISDCAELPAAPAGRVRGEATIDGQLVASISAEEVDGQPIVQSLVRLDGAHFEDHGIETVNGVAARRCSVLIDGNLALAALPALSMMSGEFDRPLSELPVWRGELNWWKSADRQVVLARVTVGGHPADAWQSRGLRGEVSAEFQPLHWMAR
ncbi:hypothetical protein BH23CHL7_BH23CHL7_14870 [soil metagenome]